MQPDRRFVQDMQQILRASRLHDREPGTLRLTARKGRHRPVEREMAKTQLLQ
ncbi:hypothetical protein ABN034_24795 [Actinopolymorpha sp. B11F2]|uniref:hypothetical protein n=1 Tax=Actinopolymorpha sp. B11F2 TaxID=3160862 RepID=UPI0032E39CF1